MFYYKTFKRYLKRNHLITMFETAYEIKKDVKIDHYNYPLMFPKYNLVVVFGEYQKKDKKIATAEELGYKVFNLPDRENVYTAAGRLLYVLNNN